MIISKDVSAYSSDNIDYVIVQKKGYIRDQYLPHQNNILTLLKLNGNCINI